MNTQALNEVRKAIRTLQQVEHNLLHQHTHEALSGIPVNEVLTKHRDESKVWQHTPGRSVLTAVIYYRPVITYHASVPKPATDTFLAFPVRSILTIEEDETVVSFMVRVTGQVKELLDTGAEIADLNIHRVQEPTALNVTDAEPTPSSDDSAEPSE